MNETYTRDRGRLINYYKNVIFGFPYSFGITFGSSEATSSEAGNKNLSHHQI